MALTAAGSSPGRALSFTSYPRRRSSLGQHATHILARIIANALSDQEGWKMIVENKPGAVMTIGIADVLKQEPDGYK